MGMALVLLIFFLTLACRSETYLEENRPQLGNLYAHLKTARHERFYGFVWFVQRIGLVATLVFFGPFYFQFALVQCWLIFKPIWFAYRMPYKKLENGLSDFANDICLLFIHLCMASWITNNVADDTQRYQFGWIYAALVVLLFLLNVLFITYSIIRHFVHSIVS
jgi:hypothetical protein